MGGNLQEAPPRNSQHFRREQVGRFHPAAPGEDRHRLWPVSTGDTKRPTMITEDNLKVIAHQLLHKSRVNEVEWKLSKFADGSGDFLIVVLPNSQVRVFFRSPETEPDFVVLELCNRQGHVVAQLVSEENTENW